MHVRVSSLQDNSEMSYRVTQEQCIQDQRQLDEDASAERRLKLARDRAREKQSSSGRSAAGRPKAAGLSIRDLKAASLARAAPAGPKPKPPALRRSQSLEARGLVPLEEQDEDGEWNCAAITEHFVEDRTEMGGAGNPFDVLGGVCPLDVEPFDPGWQVVGGLWKEIT